MGTGARGTALPAGLPAAPLSEKQMTPMSTASMLRPMMPTGSHKYLGTVRVRSRGRVRVRVRVRVSLTVIAPAPAPVTVTVTETATLSLSLSLSLTLTLD